MLHRSNRFAKKVPQHSVDVDEMEPWSLADFYLGNRLGKGKYGNVLLACEKKSKYVVAIKAISKRQIRYFKLENQTIRGIKIHYRLHHPNILSLYGYFDDERRIYLILKYAKHGSMLKFLKDQERFDERTAAIYVRDLTKALIYCHSQNLIHHNIKPDNLLIGDNYKLQMADFGRSVHSPSSRCIAVCGTLDYSSPEMVEGKPHSYAVDIWSLGVMCYELLVGLPPFDAKNFYETMRNIVNVLIMYPDYISEKAKDLMGKLLVRNYRERLPLTQVLHHPWILENAPEGAQPIFCTIKQK